MTSDTRIGVVAALEALPAASTGAPPDENHDDFFDLDGPDGGESPVSTPRATKRGPGRPQGSPNKRTDDLRRFILARYKHPVVALMDIGSMRAEDLADFLKCERLEAIALQVKCLAEAAPYIDSKMPARIQITDKDRLPVFGLEFAGGAVSVTDKSGNKVSLTALAMRAKIAMDQRLGGGEAVASNAGASNEPVTIDAKPLDPLEFSEP